MIVDHLGHRTAHIKIDDVIGPGLQKRRDLRQQLRLGSEKLKRNRALLFTDIQQKPAVFVFIMHRFGADHLRAYQAAALFPAEQAKRQVRHTCHRRQYNWSIQNHAANFQLSFLCH